MLPLERGIYIGALRACRGASNADTLSYWGGDNGINGSKLTCKITRLKRRGATFILDRTCRPVGAEGKFDDRTEVRVLSRTAFTIRAAAGSGSGQTFRYCGSKMAF
jgi:hypothetical protein